MQFPKIIQGGMGVGVSGWRLARTVSMAGQLGVVSGTAIDAVLARRLQLGDKEGDLRRAIANFPLPKVGQRVLNRYWIEAGKPSGKPFRAKAILAIEPSEALLELLLVSSFVEVFLAKEGHDGVVGINLMEKIQLPTLASLYGAMLAGVDYVLMGAGIPRSIPGALDALSEFRPVELPLDVHGASSGQVAVTRFDPGRHQPPGLTRLKRPNFLAIVSSATLATSLARKANGQVDGFVVEGNTAGGHNTPPRGPLHLSDEGEPIYGERDQVDYEALRELGLPFWLAGSYGTPERLQEALQIGAAGIQVGTPFAFCEESGLRPDLKAEALTTCGQRVFTDPVASPTGFPFKVLELDGTLGDPSVYAERMRICDLGYLRQTYLGPDQKIGYRCPAEPVENFIAKGGAIEATEGRKCLCNSLLATIGLAQVRKDGFEEPPIITAGDDFEHLGRFLENGKTSYTAADVLAYLLGPA